MGIASMLFISPDALLIRLVEAGDDASLGVRGLLIGFAVALFSLFLHRGRFFEVYFAALRVKFLYAFSFFCGLTFFTVAVMNTKVFNVLVILACAPILSALGASLVRKEPIERSLWIVSVVVLACVFSILWDDLEGGHLLGDLAAFGTTITLATNANIVREHRDLDTLSGLSMAGFLTAAVWLPGATLPGAGHADWIWLGVNGLFLMPASIILLNYASKWLPPPEVNLLFIIEMTLSPILVWLVLEEAPSIRVLVAGVTAVMVLVVYYFLKLGGMLENERLKHRG